MSTSSFITTSFDVPGAAGTDITRMQGSNIVGDYVDATGTHGFLYDGSTWTTLDMPGSNTTVVYGIDGNTLVGSYLDADGLNHGFVATPVPEPSTMIGVLLGLLGVERYLRAKRKG
jgi:hypothetical protein